MIVQEMEFVIQPLEHAYVIKIMKVLIVIRKHARINVIEKESAIIQLIHVIVLLAIQAMTVVSRPAQ